MRRLGVAALLLGLWACDKPVAPPPVREVEPAPEVRFVPPEGFTRLRIASTPYLDPQTLQASMQPLAAYLQKHLGVEVEIVAPESYAHVGELMRAGEVDLASFSPLSYVRARQKDPAMVPVVNFISDGSATSAGYVVVRADGPLRSLQDLKGKSFAFVDPSSTTGYLYPSVLLKMKGIDHQRDFSRTLFTGNHEASLMAVYDGAVDAAAIYQGALPALERSRGVDPLSFRIIAKTMRTPKDMFCARAGLPEAVVTQIRRAMLALTVRTEEGRRILGPLNVNGFIPADDALYDSVREVDAQFKLASGSRDTP